MAHPIAEEITTTCARAGYEAVRLMQMSGEAVPAWEVLPKHRPKPPQQITKAAVIYAVDCYIEGISYIPPHGDNAWASVLARPRMTTLFHEVVASMLKAHDIKHGTF